MSGPAHALQFKSTPSAIAGAAQLPSSGSVGRPVWERQGRSAGASLGCNRALDAANKIRTVHASLREERTSWPGTARCQLRTREAKAEARACLGLLERCSTSSPSEQDGGACCCSSHADAAALGPCLLWARRLLPELAYCHVLRMGSSSEAAAALRSMVPSQRRPLWDRRGLGCCCTARMWRGEGWSALSAAGDLQRAESRGGGSRREAAAGRQRCAPCRDGAQTVRKQLLARGSKG